ncbi:DUF1410 domain-containing protein [Mesomycoplasma molare]|uniref:DUF1410 domain-containing protein n=1 Tax=Mesomycoplasma molare TaxID=171288 RepID=A0ABY5TTY2_9BACT|nr:DUF1410 domain-containing protein [Mesomycoplasma molare]UWD34122.1 DUF1410 domain-containing protein [Mesomycoplasma molare]
MENIENKQELKEEKKRKKKKFLLFLIPPLFLLTAASTITATVLILNKDSKNPQANSYSSRYNYNKKGDIQLEVALPASATLKYKNKKILSVFMDENGKKHYVKSSVDENGKFSLDTSSLPNPGEYNLLNIIDQESNNSIMSREEFPEELKETIKKPAVSGTVSYDSETKDKILNLSLNKGLVNKELELSFVNEKGEVFTTKVQVSENGELIFNSSVLPEGSKWTLSNIKDVEGNLESVVNIDDMPEDLKTIDKQNYKNTFSSDETGNTKLNLNLGNENANKNAVAIFKDKNGKEYKVEATTDEQGNVSFNTSSLPNPGEYSLDRVVEKDNESNVLKSNEKLSSIEKSSIKKPEISIQKDLSDSTGSTINLELHPSRANEEVSLLFRDSKGNEIKIPATVGKDGKLIVNTNDALPEGEKYTLVSITDSNNNKVADLSNVDKEDLTIDKVNYNDGKVSRNENGDILINANLGTENSNKKVKAVFVNKEGEKFELEATTDEQGNVFFWYFKLTESWRF